MENYEKARVCEVPDDISNHISGIHSNAIHMRVSGGSKIRNLMEYAFKNFKGDLIRQITWTGSGTGVTKVIHCIEIMKRKLKGLYQISAMSYKRIEEYWKPKIEGLESLKVNRDLPKLMVLLSKDPLDPKIPGYQSAESQQNFCKIKHNSDKPSKMDKSKKGSDYSNNNKKKKVRRQEKVKENQNGDNDIQSQRKDS